MNLLKNGADSLFDAASMALCACSESKLLFASCGNMSIMIVGEKEKKLNNEYERQDKTENHNENKHETESANENYNENKDETENTSENHDEYENKGETENADGSHSFSDCLYVDVVCCSPDSNSGFKLASPEPRFVCGIRDFKPSDTWVIAASQGVTDFISPAEIGQIAKSAESSSELAYKIVATVRASSSKDSASVIAYSIKEANSY